jgi:hypothetical protein
MQALSPPDNSVIQLPYQHPVLHFYAKELSLRRNPARRPRFADAGPGYF